MRYILYIVTLALVFTAGMLISNLYIPEHNTNEAVAVAVPGLESTNPILSQITPEQAQASIDILNQALSSCPIVVDAEKEKLWAHITLFLALKDFELKKAIYEAEIAKNVTTTRTTAQFSRAAEEYAQAKRDTEQLIEQLFPRQLAQDSTLDAAETQQEEAQNTSEADTAAAPETPAQ